MGEEGIVDTTDTNLWRILNRGELKVCSWTIWKVYHGDGILVFEVNNKNEGGQRGYVLGFLVSSFTTTRELYPRPAHHPAIRPKTKSLPFLRLINSAPGINPTNSSHRV
jgi:hypothetical protein